MWSAYYYYYSDVLGIDGTTMKSQITLDEMQSVPNGRTVSVSMIKTKKKYIKIYIFDSDLVLRMQLMINKY